MRVRRQVRRVAEPGRGLACPAEKVQSALDISPRPLRAADMTQAHGVLRVEQRQALVQFGIIARHGSQQQVGGQIESARKFALFAAFLPIRFILAQFVFSLVWPIRIQ